VVVQQPTYEQSKEASENFTLSRRQILYERNLKYTELYMNATQEMSETNCIISSTGGFAFTVYA
jgi:hypothetical protein